MRYAIFTFLLLLVMLIAALGFRKQSTSLPPFEIFPDMDRQEKVMYQAASDLYTDGIASRKPVIGSIPNALQETPVRLKNGKLAKKSELGGRTDDFFNTGQKGGKDGDGFPAEVLENGEISADFLMKGKENYEIYCAICHGTDASGKGMLNNFIGFQNIIANLREGDKVKRLNGNYFKTISDGFGQMKGYKSQIGLRERWAIIAYMRALQADASK